MHIYLTLTPTLFQPQDFYDSVYKRTRAKFDTYVDKGTLLHNFAHIFELLARLRQAVDHPYLITNSNSNAITSSQPSSSRVPKKDKDANEGLCAICHEEYDVFDSCKATCGHSFCKDCIHEYVSTITEGPIEEDENGNPGW